MVKIIAEISGNHKGCKDNAIKLIRQAKECGADLVKFQALVADRITMPEIDFKASGLWEGRNLYELYKEAETPVDWWTDLLAEGDVFASVFDLDSLAILEDMGCPIYKISSFEAKNYPLIDAVVATGKEVIVSTGTLDSSELRRLRADYPLISYMNCSSNYPALLADYDIFNGFNNYSDHLEGVELAAFAYLNESDYIEKHFKGDLTDTVDDAFSLNTLKFKEYCDIIKCNTHYEYELKPANKQYASSVWVAKDIKKGEEIKQEHLTICRPFNGIEPEQMGDYIGTTASKDYKRGDSIGK